MSQGLLVANTMGNSAARRLKVLVVPSWYPDETNPYAGIFIQQQVAALALHHDVSVLFVSFGDSCPEPQLAIEDGVTAVRVSMPLTPSPTSRIDNLRMLWRLTAGYHRAAMRGYEMLRQVWGNPDVVHVHAAFPAVTIGRAVARRARAPYVVTEHQAEFLSESPGFLREGGRLRPLLVKRAMRQAAAMIAVSSYLARSLKSGGFHPEPVVVPNLVSDIDLFPATASRADGPPRILHVSLMRAYEKNIPMLLEALRMVDERGCEFDFTFVGDGPDRHEMESLARQLGVLDRRVRFIGARSGHDLRELYVHSDFSVVSSRYETFCLVAAESIAAGCPVVSTRCGGPEDFVDEHVGMLVENDDAAAMADAIMAMMSRYACYDRDAMRGYVAELFAPDTVVSMLTAVYEAVLDAAQSRRGTHTRE